MQIPLLVHLMFHPGSAAARDVALGIRRALNCDGRLPGLRVPTVILAEDGTGLPPARHPLDEAQHSVVVFLADDFMLAQDVIAGRRSWPDFAVTVADACTPGRHRFLPVQLSSAAWPLHKSRFGATNFLRAIAIPPDERQAWLDRRLVIEITRHLLGMTSGEKLPLRIMISHSKFDISNPPRMFDAVIEHLNVTQPVETWVDSARIEVGKSFADAIESGVHTSAVLVLGTTHYSSRPWCCREVLSAKKAGRPVVVLDGLQDVDARRFPYLGNVPVVGWSSEGPRIAIDMLLKEALRIEHVKRILGLQRRDGDAVLVVAPELLTLTALPRNSNVLYPDPPLGDEEVEVLSRLGHRLETPLQRAAADGELRGRKIALSISESGDAERYGTFPAQLDEALLDVSRQLLVRGATLVYGGHLGSDGYTEALCDLVRAHQSSSSLPPVERIVNYMGWPQTPEQLSIEKRALMSDLVTFVRVGRPAGVESLEAETFVDEPPTLFGPDSPQRRYAWCRGMTAMRERQSRETSARIVIGGKVGPAYSAAPDGGRSERWYSGRMPGTIEEALLTLEARWPLYVCGAYGGGARLVCDLLRGLERDDFTWKFQRQAPHSEEVRNLYRKMQQKWTSYRRMRQQLKTIGMRGLAANNGLSAEENLELFGTRDMSRMVELILKGLAARPAPKL